MRNISYLSALLMFFCLLACEEEPVNERLLQQKPIVVSGDWVLDKIYQNNLDITNSVELGTFVLTLNYNGDQPTTYLLNMDKRYPFVVEERSGQWTFDNLNYPNVIHFIPNDTLTTKLNEPLYSENNTILSITFNMGCNKTEYVYQFRKEVSQ